MRIDNLDELGKLDKLDELDELDKLVLLDSLAVAKMQRKKVRAKKEVV